MTNGMLPDAGCRVSIRERVRRVETMRMADEMVADVSQEMDPMTMPMTMCNRCAILPLPIEEVGTLYIAPPHVQTGKTLMSILRAASVEFQHADQDILAVALRPGVLPEVSVGANAMLSRAEMDDTRCIILPVDRAPNFRDLMQASSLTRLAAKLDAAWLVDVMREGRLTSWFQPLVRADGSMDIFAYECLLRGTAADGSLINPKRMFDIARDADLLFHLDRVARLTAIQASIEQNIDTSVFINFNPTSIYNPASCLQSTIRAIQDARIEPHHIVFEVVESDDVDDVKHLLKILDFYRAAGFRVALDDVGAGFSSLNVLAHLRPDFVKLDSQLIRDVDSDSYKAGLAARLLDFARSEGIETVVEGVETEGEYRWACENGASLIQGYYIARPAAVPHPVVLAHSAAA